MAMAKVIEQFAFHGETTVRVKLERIGE